MLGALDITEKCELGKLYGGETIRLDAQPDVAETIEAASEIAQRSAQRDTMRKEKEADDSAKFHTAKEYVERVGAEVEVLREAKDLEGLLAYCYPQPCPDLSMVRDDIGLDKTIAELRKERAEAEKEAWIEAMGSDHLKRAFGKGYDCQRLYVHERAAVEAPGFTVDYENASDWKSRACPSSKALDIEDAALSIAQKLDLGAPETVWLTAPAQDVHVSVETEDEGFEPCEAVVLRKYLGRYDLVQMV